MSFHILNASYSCCRCIGTIQHLKSKFGSGYILEVKQRLTYSTEQQNVLTEKLKAYVENSFPGSTQTESFAERAVYKIPQASITALAHAFGTIESGRYEVFPAADVFQDTNVRVSSCPINPIFLELSYKVLYFQQISYKSMVPTGTGNQGKPGKMGRHFPVREKSGNFVKTGKVREFCPKYWKYRKI